MKCMEDTNFEQQELFRQEKYISDLVEQKTPKNKSSLNTIFGSSILTSMIVLSFLYVFGIFDEDELIIPDPITITELAVMMALGQYDSTRYCIYR